MAGPLRLFKYYTTPELQTLFASLKKRMLTGQITATGGAGKSSSQEYLAIEDSLRAVQLEMDIRSGYQRPQKVEQVLVRPFSGGVSTDGFFTP